MIDGRGREIDHLRLSLTDHCNLACRYCIPDGVQPKWQMLDADFAASVVHWLATDHGITHLRLTGGEPLLYPRLPTLIERLSRTPGLQEISLTTNGQALAKTAERLAEAGLSRVNVSLDTLSPERFADVTRGGAVKHTLAGIEAAVAAGLVPVKINVVAQRGLNEEELVDLARWGLTRGCTVRFLEVMPIGPTAHIANRHLVPAREILKRLASHFELRPTDSGVGKPATDYTAVGTDCRGVLGVIAATTRPFCAQCRRVRVTSRGMLVACLHEDKRFELMSCWDGDELDVKRADVLLDSAITNKPGLGSRTQSLPMVAIGG